MRDDQARVSTRAFSMHSARDGPVLPEAILRKFGQSLTIIRTITITRACRCAAVAQDHADLSGTIVAGDIFCLRQNQPGCPPTGVRRDDESMETLNSPGIAARNAWSGLRWTGARLQYLIGEDRGLEHYENYATSIEYPTETQQHEPNPELLRGPRSITSLEEVEPREMTLNECIRMALTNADIIVDDQSFGSPSNPLLGNPSRVASVWDNAIQDTGFLFGNLGPEAALSNFDPILTNSLQGGVSEDPQNDQNIGIPAGRNAAESYCPVSNSTGKDHSQQPARWQLSMTSTTATAIRRDFLIQSVHRIPAGRISSAAAVRIRC